MSDTLYERSNSADDSYASLGGSTAWWEGQTFTPSIQHTVTSVKLFLYRDDGVLPGTVTVSIRNTSAGLPTGADLVSGTFNGNTATTSGAGNWEEFTFTGSTTQLAASTTYAIAIRVSAATAQIKSKATNPGQYTGGTAVSSGDSGGTGTGGGEAGLATFFGWSVSGSDSFRLFPLLPSPEPRTKELNILEVF